MHEKMIWTTKNISRDGRACSQENLTKPKSLRRTSLETLIPPTAVWRILRKNLIMKPYKLDVSSVSGGTHIEYV